LRQAGGKLDVDLGPVIEDLPRLPGRVAFEAIAKAQLFEIDGAVGNGWRGAGGLGALALEGDQVGGGIAM
jgi:hypothetical protein